jgi:acetyl esterase/lipase
VIFHGKPVKVRLPAGIALGSPSLDLTRSMQSSETHAQYDYLPPPSINPANSPPCDIWPKSLTNNGCRYSLPKQTHSCF